MSDVQRTEESGQNERARRKVIRQTPEDGVELIYTNNVSLFSTPWDITAEFGMLFEADAKTLILRSQARVVMSPQHAKALSVVLNRVLDEYETEFGPIPQPRDTDLDGDDEASGSSSP